MLLFRTRMLAEGYLQPLLELLFPRRDLPRVLSPANGSIQLHVSNSIALATSCSSCLILENVSSALKLKLRHLKSLSRCATASGSWMQLGPPGFPVMKVTNSRSSFGKIPKIPVVKLMTYLHANTFIIARKWPTLTHFYQLHKIYEVSMCPSSDI